MTIALLQSAGATVVDRCDTQGSDTVRSALTSGAIDMYWEYTGTAWRIYLRQEASLTDPDELFTAVRDADAANGVSWLRQAPFDNTYAVGRPAADADRGSACGPSPTSRSSSGPGRRTPRCASTRSSPAARTGWSGCWARTASSSPTEP